VGEASASVTPEATPRYPDMPVPREALREHPREVARIGSRLSQGGRMIEPFAHGGPVRIQSLSVMLVLGPVAAPVAAQHRSGGLHSRGQARSSHPRSYSARPKTHATHPRAEREHRSQAAKDEFMRQTGHPHGWPGHVVDHIVPLACGGADAPSNMQWQTVEEAKDGVERNGCAGQGRR
jgi:hypothetical protein